MPRDTAVMSWNPEPVITGQQLADARSRAHLSQRQLAQLLQQGERTVQNWEKDGVPRGKEAHVRSVLGNYLETGHEQQPLAAYSDFALLTELGRRLEELRKHQADHPKGPDTPKRGRGARKMIDDDDTT